MGPQLDLDPDIFVALGDNFDFDNSDSVCEYDFIIQADEEKEKKRKWMYKKLKLKMAVSGKIWMGRKMIGRNEDYDFQSPLSDEDDLSAWVHFIESHFFRKEK